MTKDKSNELTTEHADTGFALFQQPDNLPACVEDSREEMSIDGLVWAKTPSGGAQSWELKDGLGGVESVKTISGLLVVYARRGVLWPTDSAAIQGTQPVLVSSDIRASRNMVTGTAYRVGDDLGDIDPDILDAARIDGQDDAYDLSKLYYCQWGSGRNGGRRFKEQRVLGILPPGAPMPIMTTIQPGSLKNITGVMRHATASPVPFWRRLATLTLSKEQNSQGQDYSQVHMQLSAEPVISEEDGARVLATYTSPIMQELKERRISVEE